MTRRDQDRAAEIVEDLGPMPNVSRQEAAEMVGLYFGDEPSEVLEAIAEALYLAYRSAPQCPC